MWNVLKPNCPLEGKLLSSILKKSIIINAGGGSTNNMRIHREKMGIIIGILVWIEESKGVERRRRWWKINIVPTFSFFFFFLNRAARQLFTLPSIWSVASFFSLLFYFCYGIDSPLRSVFFQRNFVPTREAGSFLLTWPLLKINTYSFLVFFSLLQFLLFFHSFLEGFFSGEREKKKKKKKKKKEEKKRKSKKKERKSKTKKKKKKKGALGGGGRDTFFFSEKRSQLGKKNLMEKNFLKKAPTCPYFTPVLNERLNQFQKKNHSSLLAHVPDRVWVFGPGFARSVSCISCSSGHGRTDGQTNNRCWAPQHTVGWG